MRVKHWFLLALCVLGYVHSSMPFGICEPVVTLRNSGSSTNRIDIAILGDGYTIADMAKYTVDVDALVSKFFADEPYKEYQRYFNVHRVDVTSAESGSDHPESVPPISKNTAFDSTYNCGGIARLVCISTSKVLAVAAASLSPSQRDILIVLVNDAQYGGSGGAVPVASTHPSSSEIMLHELGHSFGGLADEYDTSPPTCVNTIEPAEANATRQTQRDSIKWGYWIASATPIPTQMTAPAIPGLYLGARYCTTGLYRPTHDSKMRTLGKQFEQINTQELIKQIYEMVSPIESSQPTDSQITSGGQSISFSVLTLAPLTHSLQVRWLVDGIERGTGSQFVYGPAGATPGNHSVTVLVEDRTNLARGPDWPFSESRTWTVVVSGGCVVSLSAVTHTFGSAGGIGRVDVTAPASCTWTAQASASWISASSGASGSGNGTVEYAVGVHTGTAARGGSLAIGGQTLSVAQAGVQLPGSLNAELFVPIVLSSTGLNNSFFTSELALTNRGTQDALVTFTYTASFGDGSGTASAILPGGQQTILPDAITYLRSIGIPIPASGNRGGSLGVRFSGLSSSADAAATVRTTTSVPEGRAGLAYEGIPAASAVQGPAYLCGLRHDEHDRSNVAVQHAGRAADGPIVLRLTVFSGDPGKPFSAVLPEITLSPGEFQQVTGILAGFSLTTGYVRVERVIGTARFYAYAVINDQRNSDGSFVAPILESSLEGVAGFSLPVVVQAGGFSTELSLTNWGPTRKVLRFDFVAEGIETANQTASFSIELNPGVQLIIRDLVSWMLQQGVAGLRSGLSYAGPLFASVEGADAKGLFMGARTSAASREGRFGLFYAASPFGRAATSSVWLFGLQQNAENRSNLALVNTGEVDGNPDTFQIELFDGSTRQKVGTINGIVLEARRWMQIGLILAQYAPGTSQGYAKITRVAGANPFLAYAVINDGGQPGQRTGDGAFISSSP